VEGDVTILEAGTGDSPNPSSDDDDDEYGRNFVQINYPV
jgi:hypothetical protein